MVKVSEYLGSFKKTNKKIPVLDSERYRIDDNSYPVCYNLVDLKNDISYRLCFKESQKDDDFYYAQEIIDQSDNQYIYYKSGFSHYSIINTQTKEEWTIPSKEKCKELCAELNSINNSYLNLKGCNKKHRKLDRDNKQRKAYQRVLEDKIRRLKENRIKVLEDHGERDKERLQVEGKIRKHNFDRRVKW